MLPTERYAVTGVGAPSYTSGTHIWNGTIAILNPNPAIRNTAASTSAERVSPSALRTAAAISSSDVEPERPNRNAIPYSVTAELIAPSNRYFSPASLERPSFRKATRMYRLIPVISSATNIAIRSIVLASSIIPAADASTSP